MYVNSTRRVASHLAGKLYERLGHRFATARAFVSTVCTRERTGERRDGWTELELTLWFLNP